MLTVKTLTVKNFLSVGNQAQAINFEGKNLVLVLGENVDLGGDDAGARNGTGKTTIINAISYAFFGDALTQIRKDNLVNKTNNKDMLVSITFEKNDTTYTIERGRKPAKLKFYINDVEQESNEAQGENRETQHEINKLLGMTHAMFKNIIALNTYTQPFLATKQAEQREIIEQLLGITILSEKADLLKDQMRGTKDELMSEKYRLDSIKQSNDKISESIKTIKLRSSAWQTQKEEDVAKFKDAIEELQKVDITAELDAHKRLQKHNEDSRTLASLQKEKAYHENSLTKADSNVEKTKSDIVGLGFKEESNISLFYNQISTFSPTPTIRVVQSPYILYVSGVDYPSKNHLSFIKTFHEMDKKGFKPMLIFAGNGDENSNNLQEINKLISKLSLNERVKIFLNTDSNTLHSLYYNCEFTVFPSLYEGFGRPIIESILYDKKVYSSQVGIYQELKGHNLLYPIEELKNLV